jgi:hypothetical protein
MKTGRQRHARSYFYTYNGHAYTVTLLELEMNNKYQQFLMRVGNYL